MTTLVYGCPPLELADPGPDAVQTSPLIPGSASLEELTGAAADRAIILAPAGTIERRYVLAQAIRAVRPGGEIVALALKDRGGLRLKADLAALGCEGRDESRRHHRIVSAERPIDPAGLDEAIAAGALREAGPNVWTQPGVFSWDRTDPGSERLLGHLHGLAGSGADFGCGIGVLSRRALRSAEIKSLVLVDIDRRAIEAARLNIADPRASFLHGDVLQTAFSGLDFVMMNPPFHAGGQEDRNLGQSFIRMAAGALRKGGRLLMVANIDLPYESVLQGAFKRVEVLEKGGGFKMFGATK